MHKDIEKILYSEQDIENIVKRLAKEIEKDYNGKDFIMVGLLKGCVSFMVDLMREVNLDFGIDFLAVSSYGNSTVSSGRTLAFISQYLYAKNAASVKICTLFNKPERRVADIDVAYVGSVIPDAFIVGYGLDYAEKYRNLPYVGVLKESVYSHDT